MCMFMIGEVSDMSDGSACALNLCIDSSAIAPCTLPGTFNVRVAARSCLCHLCQSAVPSAHAVCLFGPTASRQSLPSRISDLFDVPIAENDGYPEHICEKCKRRVERLEKAVEGGSGELLKAG